MTSRSPLLPPPVATPGQDARTVSTPALLIDLDAFDHNIRQMAALARRHGVALRPHAKAHKSSAIAKVQLEQGATGVCCQKLSEAYPFVNEGIGDIHISNQFVGEAKIAMAVELAQHVRLSVCVDHPAPVDALGNAARRAGVVISVLTEVDVGHGRCGVANEDALLALADRIACHDALRFGGVQAYHGGIQHLANWEDRKRAASRAAALTVRFVQSLESRGIGCPVVTGGGTGTAEFDVASGVYTEIQPGSYVFMDGHYGANGWSRDLELRQSLFIASTIMSTTKPGRAVCDVGLKGVAVDSGVPCIRPGELEDRLRYIAANDEHGILQTNRGEEAKMLEELLGRQLLLIPGHCDPTCNLYAEYAGVRNEIVECVWKIDARGLSQ